MKRSRESAALTRLKGDETYETRSMRHIRATITTATVHDQSLGEKVAIALSHGLGCGLAVATLTVSDEPVQHPRLFIRCVRRRPCR